MLQNEPDIGRATVAMADAQQMLGTQPDRFCMHAHTCTASALHPIRKV